MITHDEWWETYYDGELDEMPSIEELNFESMMHAALDLFAAEYPLVQRTLDKKGYPRTMFNLGRSVDPWGYSPAWNVIGFNPGDWRSSRKEYSSAELVRDRIGRFAGNWLWHTLRENHPIDDLICPPEDWELYDVFSNYSSLIYTQGDSAGVMSTFSDLSDKVPVNVRRALLLYEAEGGDRLTYMLTAPVEDMRAYIKSTYPLTFMEKGRQSLADLLLPAHVRL